MPLISGHANARRLIRADFIDGFHRALEADRRARYRGEAAAMVPVVAQNPLDPSALPTPDSWTWFTETHKLRAPSWKNEVTLRSVEMFMEYEPGAYLAHVSPTPLQIVVATGDVLTVADQAIAGYERALHPKRLVCLKGGHFDAYVAGFEQASTAASSWFKEHFERLRACAGETDLRPGCRTRSFFDSLTWQAGILSPARTRKSSRNPAVLMQIIRKSHFGKGALAACAVAAASAGALTASRAQDDLPKVDAALILTVDVSSSVDEKRYQLQMEGIAAALEDEGVINTVLGGANGAILISMVTWADKAKLSIPWTMVTNAQQAKALANTVRTLPQQEGEFTCMGRMARYIADKVVARMPAKAEKIVVDVSGDGPDNCNTGQLLENSRSDLFGIGVTINGLPILEGKDAETIEEWYKEHVIGGPGAFIVAAKGYEDFARAFRQKFVVEVSQNFGPSK